MRQILSRMAACALLAGWPVGIAGADEPGFIGRVFGSGEAETPPAATPRAEKPPVVRLDPREDAARQFQVAQAEYMRRLEVIDRFRMLAARNDNHQLDAKLLRLEESATELFHASTAHLPVGRLGSVESLDSSLGRGAAVDPLTSAQPPARGNPTGTASLDRGSFPGGNR